MVSAVLGSVLMLMVTVTMFGVVITTTGQLAQAMNDHAKSQADYIRNLKPGPCPALEGTWTLTDSQGRVLVCQDGSLAGTAILKPSAGP